MTSQTRATLKGYFNTNDQPTEAHFADLIDSAVNIADTNPGVGTDEYALVWDNDTARFVLRAPSDIDLRLVHNVVCLGDSITSNIYPSELQLLLDANIWHVVNQGIGGNTTAQMLARFEVCVTNDTEYVVILGGINDVLNGVDAAAIEANLEAMYYLAHHNAGMVVIAATITPFKNHASWNADKQAVVDAVNAWIMAGPENVDYSVNAYAALEDGSAADALRAAYDSGDGLHPNSTGFAALAAEIYGQLTWVPASEKHSLLVNGVDVYLNQSLATFDSPIFNRLTINNLVGIGTTTPATALHVVGAATITGGIRPAADSTTALQLQNVSGTSVLNVDTTNSNIGIGTTSPGARLDIKSGSNSAWALRVRSSTADQELFGIYQGPTGNADFYLYDLNSTVFFRSTPAVTYLMQGNIGIGTTSPATRLDIDAGALTMAEMTAPTGAANKAMLYTKDNGSGKTQLCCKLGDDVEIVIATQA